MSQYLVGDNNILPTRKNIIYIGSEAIIVNFKASWITSCSMIFISTAFTHWQRRNELSSGLLVVCDVNSLVIDGVPSRRPSNAKTETISLRHLEENVCHHTIVFLVRNHLDSQCITLNLMRQWDIKNRLISYHVLIRQRLGWLINQVAINAIHRRWKLGIMLRVAGLLE